MHSEMIRCTTGPDLEFEPVPKEQRDIHMKRATLTFLGTTALLALGTAMSGCEQGPGPRKTPVEQSKMYENPQESSGAAITGSQDGESK